MKAVEYQKCYENMEAMKIDLTINKGKYTVDNNSIIQEIDQVRKKQTVHKARFADIEREVSLLKIQIREPKKDDVGSQSLKKRIKEESDCQSGDQADCQDGAFLSYKFHIGRPKQGRGDLLEPYSVNFPSHWSQNCPAHLQTKGTAWRYQSKSFF